MLIIVIMLTSGNSKQHKCQKSWFPWQQMDEMRPSYPPTPLAIGRLPFWSLATSLLSSNELRSGTVSPLENSWFSFWREFNWNSERQKLDPNCAGIAFQDSIAIPTVNAQHYPALDQHNVGKLCCLAANIRRMSPLLTHSGQNAAKFMAQQILHVYSLYY